ncbi:MAG: rod shape-determining protein MreC [Flavobacteriaceae bacterium]|jgi:rod shape-determining protein MreC|nr:rod shape-determining protein MreC [Flavobacteriaceae bacterium]
MQFILNPIIKNGLFIFYVLLSLLAFLFIFRQKVYHKSVLDKTSTQLSGYMDERISGVTQFINLKDDNRLLQRENSELRKELEKLKGEISETDQISEPITNLEFHQTYRFVPVEIINNSVMKSHNMLTINKGSRQGIEKGMGVISGNGVIGYVYKTSENYSRVMSTLNLNTKITAQIKRNNFFGTLIWDGKDPRYARLQEIPKYIEVEKGDTIETDGKSGVIPGGIMLGTVVNSEIDDVTGELDILVRLKEDFARLRYAQVVVNLEIKEIKQVEKIDSTAQNVKP